MSSAALSVNAEIRRIMRTVSIGMLQSKMYKNAAAPRSPGLFLSVAGVWGESQSPCELLTAYSFWNRLILKPAVQIQQHSRVWIEQKRKEEKKDNVCDSQWQKMVTWKVLECQKSEVSFKIMGLGGKKNQGALR